MIRPLSVASTASRRGGSIACRRYTDARSKSHRSHLPLTPIFAYAYCLLREERDGLIAQAKANVEAAAAAATDAKSDLEQSSQAIGSSISHTELATEPSTSTLYTTPSLASSESTPSIPLVEMPVDLPTPPKTSGIKRPAEDVEDDLPPAKRQRVDSPVLSESAVIVA